MCHASTIDDENGDIIDLVLFCSDYCNKEYNGGEYQGWYGCLELHNHEVCANCGEPLAFYWNIPFSGSRYGVNQTLAEHMESLLSLLWQTEDRTNRLEISNILTECLLWGTL